MRHFFSSESVCKGHPDKVCDQISDALLDALLAEDPLTRAAIETTACKDFVHIMGEVTTKAKIDYKEIARRTIRKIGYTKEEYGFSDRTEIIVTIHEQSPDIAMGVDSTEEIGAGDQGMMFGYATDESSNLMPLALNYARAMTEEATKAREDGTIPYLRPDGKGQITIEYEDDEPIRIDTVVLSLQHDEDVPLEVLRKDIKEKIIKKALPEGMLDERTKYYINPTGKFVLGGPAADTGLTGRKIIVDTYGGAAPHGGGAFSGKDATKVDRSASYAARNIAKLIVKSGAAKKCMLEVAYAIGIANPVSVYVNTYGTGKVSDEMLSSWVERNVSLTPRAIIERFSLRKPQYEPSAASGHFGRGQAWEKLDEGTLERLEDFVKANQR